MVIGVSSKRDCRCFLLVKLAGNPLGAPGEINKKLREKASFQEAIVIARGFQFSFTNKIVYG